MSVGEEMGAWTLKESTVYPKPQIRGRSAWTLEESTVRTSLHVWLAFKSDKGAREFGRSFATFWLGQNTFL